MVGAAKLIGGAVGQVGIQLALEKAFFNKDVQQTTKQTESAFSKSFGKIGKMTKSAFTGMGNVVSNGLSKVRDNFTQTFHKISNTIKVALVAGSAFMIKFGKDAIQAASDTQAAWTGLFSIVNGTGKSFSEAQGFLKEYVSDGLIPLTDAVTAYKTLAARGYDTKQIEEMMLALKDSAAFGRQSAYSYGEAIKSAAEGLKNENSILVDNAGVTKNVAKMWDEYAASIGTTANNLTLAQKREAEYQGIIAETKFQQGDAAKYADTYAGKLAKLSTAFFNLKVTVGQVLAPIIELLLPTITAAINGLTKMFNKLKSIMAVFGLEMKEYIGGETSSAIGGATEDASGLSSGLDSAGTAAQKAAKKIKKAFAGVDEINVLNMPNDSSSGSGGSSGGTGSIGGGTGTDGSITDGLEETTTEVTQKLDWLKRSAYDWGVAFGESINNGLGKIPWDSIQSTVVGAVAKIAEFLNGAVKGLDWHLLGSTFGEGFNTIIYGLNTFYKTFDWDSLGVGLGEGINGIIDSVDWATTGEFLGRKFSSTFQILSNMFETMNWGELGTSLGESLQNFIDNIDFNAIADTFSNGINGAFTTVGNFIENVEWGELGFDVGKSVSRFFRKTDWKNVGATISDGIMSAIRTAIEFVKGVDWAKVGESVVDVLAGIDWSGIIRSLGALLWNILIGVGEFLAGVLYGIGKNIVQGIWNGITGFLSDPFDWLKKNLVDPIVQAVKDLFGIHSPSTVFAEIGGFLIEGLWSGISGAKDWIKKKWEGVKGWFSNITKEAKVEIKQKWSDIKEKWNNLTKNIKSKTADMKAKVASKWSDLKSKWSNITKNIKNKTADMKARVATTWSNLKSKWNNLMSNFKDKTVEIKAKVGNVVGSFKSTINDKIIKPINKKLPSFFPKIPYLAQGSWFAKNNPTLAVVGDNKHEPEIVAPESKIYNQARKAVEDAGAGTTQNIEFTINVKYEDGRSIIKKINNTQIQDGKISLLV